MNQVLGSSAQPDRSAMPTMLMLSHCMAQPSDRADRARAWQLLNMMSRSYRVWLICQWDGPANLMQWRQTYRLVEQFDIASGSLLRRLLGRVVALIDSDAGKRLALGSAQTLPPSGPVLQQSFDVVLLTHPLLSSDAPLPRWGASMCDLYHIDASQTSSLARRFDSVIVKNPQQQQAAQSRGTRALLVPAGADVCLDRAAQLQPLGPIAHIHNTSSDQQDRPLAQAA